jgi:hypothetical protein
MISSRTTQSLLSLLLHDLLTPSGEPDYARFRPVELINARYKHFLDLLLHAEDDLSIIVSLLEKDPDCIAPDPIRKLQALVDYVKIASAIYNVNEGPQMISTLH